MYSEAREQPVFRLRTGTDASFEPFEFFCGKIIPEEQRIEHGTKLLYFSTPKEKQMGPPVHLFSCPAAPVFVLEQQLTEERHVRA